MSVMVPLNKQLKNEFSEKINNISTTKAVNNKEVL